MNRREEVEDFWIGEDGGFGFRSGWAAAQIEGDGQSEVIGLVLKLRRKWAAALG